MKLKRIVLAGAAALALAAGGTTAGAAVMAGPIDSAGIIHGCYYPATASGSHRVVLQNTGRRCPRGSTPISWNRRGPQGPPGQQGQPGQPGQQGQPGQSGISQGYSYGRVFQNNSGPQIAPVGSAMQPVGSLTGLPFGNYLVEASVDVENLNGGCCGNNSMDIECQISSANDTGHLFLNGNNTAEPWGTLTMITALAPFAGTVNYQCVATTGNGNASGVTVQSVRINAVALDNLSTQ